MATRGRCLSSRIDACATLAPQCQLAPRAPNNVLLFGARRSAHHETTPRYTARRGTATHRVTLRDTALRLTMLRHM